MELFWLVSTWVLAVTCLLGNIFNVMKLRVCFLIWIACNIFWIVYDVMHSNYARVLLDTVQIGFDLWGFIKWGR